MQSKQFQKTRAKLTDKFITILFGLLTISIVIYGITWYLERRHEDIKRQVLRNPVESMGIIAGVTAYKGKGVTVKYVVNQQKFEIKPSVTTKFYNSASIGDSVAIVYSKTDPDRAILKYELEKR
jgi:hypothetical protein